MNEIIFQIDEAPEGGFYQAPTLLRDGVAGPGMVQLWCEPDEQQAPVDVVEQGQVPPGMLAVLDGSCRTPIAGHATIAGTTMTFRGLVARRDGSETYDVLREGSANDAASPVRGERIVFAIEIY